MPDGVLLSVGGAATLQLFAHIRSRDDRRLTILSLRRYRRLLIFPPTTFQRFPHKHSNANKALGTLSPTRPSRSSSHGRGGRWLRLLLRLLLPPAE